MKKPSPQQIGTIGWIVGGREGGGVIAVEVVEVVVGVVVVG